MGSGGAKLATCRGRITIQCISEGGAWNSAYSYYNKSTSSIEFDGDGWYNGSTGIKVVAGDNVKFGEGEGFFIENGMDDPIDLQISGEVGLTPKNVLPGGDKFCMSGNPSPVNVSLADVSVSLLDDSELGTCRGKITAQQMDADAKWIASYAYYNKSSSSVEFDGAGWYNEKTGAKIIKDTDSDVTMTPGEAYFFQNGMDDSVKLTYPNPISK